jgi:AcrR family transcriptional regulator
VDEVTTQQIASAADIGSGTLFLYVRSKSELLLLVQNARYAEQLDLGRAAAAHATNALDAVMALHAPIVACNRVQVDNGRVYLRELVFGDPTEPRHAEALDIVARTEEATAEVLMRHAGLARVDAATLARVVSAIVYLTMATSVRSDQGVSDIIDAIRSQVAAILPS